VDRDRIERLIEELRALGARLEGEESGDGVLAPRALWLEEILAHSTDVICVLDLDGRLLYLNRSLQGSTTTPFEHLGKPVEELLPERLRAKWGTTFRAVIETGSDQTLDVDTVPGEVWTGRLVPIRRGGAIVNVLGLASETGAVREAERVLRFREEQLRLAQQATGMGQWRWSIADDEIVWDDPCKRIFGWPADRDEIRFVQYIERVHPEDRDRVREHIATAMQTSTFAPLEHRILVDGAERCVLCLGSVLCDASGHAAELIGGVIDVTQQRRNERVERRTQKLEAIGQLAGGVAHDFNNLLVAIMGNIELARGLEDPVEQTALLDDALTASHRAADLTKQLLAFGRRSQVHETPLDMNELLGDTVRLLIRLIPETIQIDHITGHRLPRVLGDRGQLEQVIVNLCINARDAMPGGGRLVLETEVVLINGRYRESHPWARPGRFVLLSISDTGVGIPADAIEHIFEPFYTGKKEGTGLGLATVYGIVKQHGGLVHVYSEVDNGTTFKVYLPVAERDAAEVGSKIEGPVRGGRETVLVAEDEGPVRHVVSRILTNAGYRVLTARDGVEALEVFAENLEAIDAVVLDAIMPRKNGTEVAGELRLMKPGVVIVLSSGYSDALAADPSFAKEQSAFLAKPYEPDTLLRTLRRAIDDANGA
jgi:signal transduction histidine kinase/ActR/RegA family two-component response regulator